MSDELLASLRQATTYLSPDDYELAESVMTASGELTMANLLRTALYKHAVHVLGAKAVGSDRFALQAPRSHARRRAAGLKHAAVSA